MGEVCADNLHFETCWFWLMKYWRKIQFLPCQILCSIQEAYTKPFFLLFCFIWCFVLCFGFVCVPYVVGYEMINTCLLQQSLGHDHDRSLLSSKWLLMDIGKIKSLQFGNMEVKGEISNSNSEIYLSISFFRISHDCISCVLFYCRKFWQKALISVD